jgi:membrane protease YdiL (CAAX protease family)
LTLAGIAGVLGFILVVIVTVAGREGGGDAELWGMAAFLLGVGIVGTFWSLLPAFLCERIGRTRSCGSTAGLLAGFFLGWIGLLIVYLFPYVGKQRKCPECAEKVKAEARVCKHCGKKLRPVED